MENKISGREWLWVLSVSLLILIVLSIPYLIGVMNSTQDMKFGGFLFGVEDANSYIAKMRYGAEDGWLFRLMYTSELHDGGFVFTFYLGLGKLAALVSGEGKEVSAEILIIAYHSARFVLGGLLLAIVYKFAALFLNSAPQRRLAWVLASMGGGLGWLGLFIKGNIGQPLEFYVPEAFGLLLPYGLPHLALARCLMLLGWMALIQAVTNHRSIDALYASIAWLLMAIVVPFHAALVGVLMMAWMIGLWVQRQQFPLWVFRMCVIAGSLPLVALLYDGWLFSTNLVFAAWSRQNQLASPPFLDFALAYGVVIAMAIVAVVSWRLRDLDEASILLLIWPPAALILANLPINVQRRLLEAVFVPLSILAVQGIWRIVGERPDEETASASWRLRQIAIGLVLMTLFPSSTILIGGGVITANQAQWPVFHSAAELSALDWLGDHAPFGSLVLSTRDAGNVLPAYAPVRVYVGHGPETIDSDRKAAEMNAFFSSQMSTSARDAFLAKAQPQYIWVGPQEQSAECGSQRCLDETTLPLILRYQHAGYTIYEVETP